MSKQPVLVCEKCGLEVKQYRIIKHQSTNRCHQWELIRSRIDINDPEIIKFEYNMRDEVVPYYKGENQTIEYKKKYLGYKEPLSVEEQIKLLEEGFFNI